MVRITIDDELKTKLFPNADTEIVELFDESGKLVGRILPEISKPPSAYKPKLPHLSDSELEQRRDYEGPGFTTEQVIAFLKACP